MTLNNEVPTEQAMLEFSEVYLRAIELSWRDAEFKKQLLKDPMYALEHYFHYTSPWNFIFKVEEILDGGPSSSAENSDQTAYGWDQQKGKWKLPPNKMSFGLPMAPEVSQQAVALALYNDAGPAYLFTCC